MWLKVDPVVSETKVMCFLKVKNNSFKNSTYLKHEFLAENKTVILMLSTNEWYYVSSSCPLPVSEIFASLGTIILWQKELKKRKLVGAYSVLRYNFKQNVLKWYWCLKDQRYNNQQDKKSRNLHCSKHLSSRYFQKYEGWKAKVWS